jgi:hypothetical protein
VSAHRKSMLAFGIPRPDKRTWFALFLLSVGAIVGGVPGWQMVFASWMVFSWLLLAGVVLSSLVFACCHAVERAWRAMRVDLGQVVYALLAAALLPTMFALPAWVDLVASYSQLRAVADASARSGSARVAATHVAELEGRGGTAYDPSGEIAKPRDQRSQQWRDSAMATQWLNNDCVEVRHLVGPYWHWSESCGRF